MDDESADSVPDFVFNGPLVVRYSGLRARPKEKESTIEAVIEIGFMCLPGKYRAEIKLWRVDDKG